MDDETAAIERLKRGDIAGLETLVRVYYLPATRAAYLVIRDRGLAEDVVQAAFIRSYEKIDQFDPGRKFGPWFMRIVVNQAAKLAAQQRRTVSLTSFDGDEAGTEGELSLADWLTETQESPETLLDQAEMRRAVWESLGRLTPAQRSVVVLRYYLELSEAETAEQLACPPGTVKRRLHDARQNLRKLLSNFRPARATARTVFDQTGLKPEGETVGDAGTGPKLKPEEGKQ